ncbi:hypothetical protein PVMG_06046 [Plasmodium vivax Mauritania I]|uniref:Variable surface protein Vir18 n=1 Tax=Plasmodium vivax Mauritania I TaxID=1035515 RepID=A0A0J9TH43_PLAVI|nr:hypothetical protein PVMG_06046 [Plasmodium vivax Mauritania I]
MSLWRSPSSRSTISAYGEFRKRDCINKYGIYKNDIDQQINNFNNSRHTPFRQKWEKLNNYIRKKNDEITVCVNEKYISADFYADESIKKFSERCPNASTCRYNPAPSVKKSRASQTETKTTCKGGVKCNKQLSSTQPANSKSQLSVSKEEPKAGGPQVHVSPEKIPKHANAQESQEEIENVEAKQDIKPSGNSVGSEPETSEPNVNSNSSPSGESENKAQSLPVVVSPANNELGTGLIDSASKNTSEEESDLLVDNETAASHSNGHLNPVSNSSCPGDSTEKPIGTAYTCPRTADSAHCTEECPDEKATLGGGSHSEMVDNGGITASSLFSKGDNGDLAEQSPIHTQDVSFISSQIPDPDHKTSCREGASSTGNDNEMICSAEKGSELVTDNGNKSDFFGKIFEVISNKDHIIQASAPMGIVMLLGLLFKYTPLWRALTKKNSKKGASINQELHSVLQEPSIMDEERSIPFSYGAFQYSSFDQNSY